MLPKKASGRRQAHETLKHVLLSFFLLSHLLLPSLLPFFLPSFLPSFWLRQNKKQKDTREQCRINSSPRTLNRSNSTWFSFCFFCVCVFFFVLFNRSPCFACFLLPNFIFFCACVVLRLSWCCSCCLAIAHAFVLLWLIFKGQLCCCVEATQAKVTSTSAPCPENCKARQGLCVCVCVCMSECVSVSQCV